MLERGRTEPHRAVARVFLLFVIGVLLASMFVQDASIAELPTETTNPNATRTVLWNMTDASTFQAESVNVSAGQAKLDWSSHTLAWARGQDFAANGTVDANLSASSAGLSLSADWSNRLQDANFTGTIPWQFTNGTTGNVSAELDQGAEDAHLWHASPTTLHLFDSMDVYANWTYTGAGVIGTNFEEASPRYQGSGSQAILINSGWSGYHSVALLRNPALPVNWSGVDRVLLWFKMNSSLNVSFNISAQIGATPVIRSTPPQSLAAGDWQLLKIDLDSLAPAENRSNLQSLKLQISGTDVPDDTWFYFDALTTGRAKVFNETASVSQTFAKTGTTPAPGSAYLSFDWNLEDETGATWFAPMVSVGNWSATLTDGTGVWHRFAADVSAHVANADSYVVGFFLQVGMNDSWETNVSLRIDNVSFVYPDRNTGTYLSNPQTFGANAEYRELTWAASTSASTHVVIGIRSGNRTDAWGPWSDFFTNGSYPLLIDGAYWFQIRAVLSTDNASLTPALESVFLTAQSHPSEGSLTSGFYNASTDFLGWRWFNASVIGAPNASVAFSVGDNSGWHPIGANTSLSAFSGRMIRWKAFFNTTDGLQTARITQVSATYDYRGSVVRIILSSTKGVNISAGDYVRLGVVAYDAGSHVIPSSDYLIDWHTTDPGGYVYNNGTYHAVTVGGPWNITASVHENPSVSATIQIWVVGGTSASSGDMWSYWPYVVAVISAAIVGFAAYELFIRRMFAIDDVFLIGKDGRLMMHNTRRMRADRDEDILSGMLTAIMSFLRDQDPEENGELKRFQVGGKTTLLERGPHAYLTAIYSGRVPRWAGKDLHRFMTDLEERFGDTFAHWSGSPEDLHGLKEFMRPFVTQLRYRRNRASRGRAS